MTTSPVRSEILENFLTHLEEVVNRCAEEILRIESYQRAGDPMRDDVRGAVRGNVESLTQVVQEGRSPNDGLAAIAKVGARRAQAGIPLDDVLRAYRIVSRVCWDVLAEQCRRVDGDPLEATIEIAEALMRYTDSLSTTVADSYAQAQRAIVREQEGARREFLADLLYGTESDAEDILERAHTYGYDLSLSYIALVGIGGGGDQGRESLVAAAVSRAVPDATADPIILEKADQTTALVPADASLDTGIVPEKLITELEEDWRFGMGGPEPGLEGIRRAYLEAKEALEIGLALGFDTRVFRFDDLLAYHFLRNDPTLVDRFVSQTLGPLIEYDSRRRGELVNTLEAFFDCDGSVKLAGESLFAHPHTVTYRLKQLERLTGWSLKDPEDKLRMQLALRAHRLAQARSDSGTSDRA